MSGIMLFKHKLILQNIHLKQLKYYIETYFGFSLEMREFVSKMINDSNIDLEKFPTTKVRQLAKRLESPKSTVRHIKKMVGDPSALQVNLLRHQRIEIPSNEAQKAVQEEQI